MTLLDPKGRDAALRRMVLIGHSQGGLLVKMQAIESGDRLWNAVSEKPLAEMRLSDENRELLQRGLFVEPLPEVGRVVFISTPHRGSFLASRFVSSLLRRLTRLPVQVVSVTADIARNLGDQQSPIRASAVDNMSPRHPFILGLQQIPVDASIPRALDHLGEGHRPVRGRQRRRGGVPERTRRAGRVRAGGTLAALLPGEPAHHRGGAPDPPAPRRPPGSGAAAGSGGWDPSAGPAG